MNMQEIVKRRTEELSSSTRSEILMSIGAALLFVAVVAWRIAPFHDGLPEIGFGAVLAWVLISLYWFRHRIWRRTVSPPDAVAAPGVDYYRKELERRRDHLRNPWLWHGPLFLACSVLVAILAAETYRGYQDLRNVMPLVVLLAVWTAYGIWRRRSQARELQREIDEM
jgi:O-antigen/teichoic acid export membrane protein